VAIHLINKMNYELCICRRIH